MPVPYFVAVSYSENLASVLLKFLIAKSFLGILYTLLKKEEILSNVNRVRLYQLISDFPGIRICDIVDKTKLPKGTLTYHTDVLEREKLILSYPDGRFRRYRLHPNQDKKSASEVLNDINRVDEVLRTNIISLIKEKDGITQREICKTLGNSRQVISYHMKKLEVDGMIRTEKYGLTKKCYIHNN